MKISFKKIITAVFLVSAIGCLLVTLLIAIYFPMKDSEFVLSENWSQKVNSEATNMSIYRGTILVSSKRSITALNGDTGARLWITEFDSSLQPYPAVVNNNIVYVSDVNTLWGIELQTGKRLLQYPLQDSHTIILDVSNKYLIANNVSNNYVAYDIEQNSMLWRLPAGRGPIQAFIDGDEIYVIDNGLKAINASDGKALWTETLDVKGKGLYTKGVLYYEGGNLYNTKTSHLVAYDVVLRKELWRIKLSSGGFGEYQYYDNKLIITDRNNVYLLNGNTGEIIWESALSEPSNISILGDHIFVLEGFSRRIIAIEILSGHIENGIIKVSLPKLLFTNNREMVADNNYLVFLQGKKIYSYAK